ncbi:MAG: twin-arginine translocase TatA/TatE family subunit [Acidobacteriota bacterium]
MGLGVPELVIIFLIVVVLFGSSRLPQLGRGLGEGISNFKRGLKTEEKSLTEGETETAQERSEGEADTKS